MIVAGMGVASTLTELLTGLTSLVDALPALIAEYPDALVVRNQVGNLAIVRADGAGIVNLGFINIRTGEMSVYGHGDEPQ